jgi:hypothetical protein
MKKIINGLVLVLGLGFSSLSLASTVDNLFAYDTDVSIGIPPALSVGIKYDSTNWASINTATLSVKMRDDSKSWKDGREYADITSINTVVNPSVNRVEVGNKSAWYWNIDVSSYLTLGMTNILLNFDLVSKKYGHFGSVGDYKFNNARLSVDYNTTPNAVPVPAALFLFAPALLGFFGLRRKAQA